MYFEYLLAVVQVGKFHVNLSVKTSCAHQCLVEHIGTVGGGKNDDATVGPEAIHLCQKLVECVFPFVVRSEVGVLATGSSHSINLINKDDAGCFFLRLPKEITHAGSAYTYKHLHEV